MFARHLSLIFFATCSIVHGTALIPSIHKVAATPQAAQYLNDFKADLTLFVTRLVNELPCTAQQTKNLSKLSKRGVKFISLKQEDLLHPKAADELDRAVGELGDTNELGKDTVDQQYFMAAALATALDILSEPEAFKRLIIHAGNFHTLMLACLDDAQARQTEYGEKIQGIKKIYDATYSDLKMQQHAIRRFCKNVANKIRLSLQSHDPATWTWDDVQLKELGTWETFWNGFVLLLVPNDVLSLEHRGDGVAEMVDDFTIRGMTVLYQASIELLEAAQAQFAKKK